MKTLILIFFLMLGVGLSYAVDQKPPVPDYLKKIQQVKKQHPDWPQNICASVAHGRVDTGMTTEQVTASWGAPKRIFEGGDRGQYKYWHYNYVVVQFKNNKVLEIRQKEKAHYIE